MNIRKVWLLVGLLIFSFFNSVFASVWMDADNEYYAGKWELTFSEDTTLEYFEIGENYTNLTWGSDYKNITYVSNGSSTEPIVEQYGALSLGIYQTTLTFDVYAPSDWSVDNIYLRLDTNTSVELENISNPSYTQKNSTHRQYSYLYNPDNADTIDWYDMQMDVWAKAHNTTLNYQGYREFDSLFEVYALDSPYNTSAIFTMNTSVNFSWTMGNYSDRVRVVQQNSSYPGTPNDGYNRQNTSTRYWLSTTPFTQYHTGLFGYNDTTRSYSPRVSCPWGAINVSVYNASNTSEQHIIPFGLLITNEDGSSTYRNTTCLYYHILGRSEISWGNTTIFQINATGYKDGIYTVDLPDNEYINKSFYLYPHNVTVDDGGGDSGENDSVSTTRLYFVQTINEYSEAVSGALVNVTQYIEWKDAYESVGILETDGYGYCNIHLQPNELYKVFVTATGYDNQTSNWIPDPTYYGLSYPKIIQLDFESSVYENETSFDEAITFEGWLSDDDTLYVNFSDDLRETIDTKLYIYDQNNITGDITIFTSDSQTGVNDWNLTYAINESRVYYAYLHLNHTTFGYQKLSIIFGGHIMPTPGGGPLVDEDWFSNLLDRVFGENPVGWTSIIVFFIFLGMVFSFGQRNTGVSLLICGFILLFINSVIGITLIGTTIPIVFIVLGILVQWRNHNREADNR